MCVRDVCCVRLQVTALEAGALLGMYVVYVCVTFYTSRTDEPLHADLALHEFPPEDGGIGKFRTHSVPAQTCQHVRQQRGSGVLAQHCHSEGPQWVSLVGASTTQCQCVAQQQRVDADCLLISVNRRLLVLLLLLLLSCRCA